jgi:uncharacterized LabA/DUF88 family protein
MTRYAIFVDAGYLIAAGGWATVDLAKRSQLIVEGSGLVDLVKLKGSGVLPDSELLRIYWYDASPNKVPMPDHQMIADLADTKLRMGHLTARGDQKGVDALLFSDLTSLSMDRKVHDAFLLAGDGDFVEAVARAQSEGVRVHLWGIKTPRSTVSPELRREADTVQLLSPDELRPYFQRVPEPEPQEPMQDGTPVSATPSEGASESDEAIPVWASVDLEEVAASGRRFASQWARLATPVEVASVLSSRPIVPGHLHYRLLRSALEEAGIPWGTRISYDATEAMRNGFWESLVQVAGTLAPTVD